MEDVDCHAPQTTQTTRDAFLGPVQLHDGVAARVYKAAKMPRQPPSLEHLPWHQTLP